MKKILSVGALATLTLGIALNFLLDFSVAGSPVQAREVGTCASKCGTKPLQFTPGQLIRLEVVNRTPRVLQLQKMDVTNSVSLAPGRAIQFEQMQMTEPNGSLLFWDDTGRALTAIVTKINVATLRVELYPNGFPPGDRSIYIRDDGKVSLL